MIIQYGRLPMSISFTCFSGILSYPFTWIISSAFSFWYLTLCDCGFCSWGCLIIVLLCTSDCPLVEEAKRLAQASWWERLLVLEGHQQRLVSVVTHHRSRSTRSNSLGMCFPGVSPNYCNITIFTMLYLISMWFIYNRKFASLYPFHLFYVTSDTHSL